MAEARSAWRALRPVFLAGAATLTWLTFSSSAASADVLSDTTSLLGGVTSTVSSVTDKVAGPALPAPAAPPAAPAAAPRSPGLLGPVVGRVSGLADNVVAAVPVVNRVIPSGAVTVVSVPVAGVVDGATASVVDVVVPPVAGAVPVLEPVLEPVADLATGAAPLPVAVPELPVVPTDADLSDGADLSAGAVVTAGGPAGADDRDPTLRSPAAADVPAASAVQGPVSAGSVVGAVALADTASPLWAPAAEFDAGAGESGTADPSPAQAPAVPGSGAGSGTSASGSSGSAAWLSVFSVDLPVPGAVRAGESSEHVPAPVSLDPGSSPD